MRRWLPVALVLLAAACSTPAKGPPNIVFILVDDLNTRLLPYLPRLQQLLPAKGLALEMSVPTPLCAPSRASILTSRYAHNTTVKTNGVWAGGVWAMRGGHNEERTVATWLRAVGYKTGFFGKYINGHDGKEADVPQGWDRWVSYKTVSMNRLGVQTIENGGVSRDLASLYDTDFFGDAAAEWVASAPQPFFAMWSPMAPHGPFVPPERYKHRFDDVVFKWPPSFSADEEEVVKLTRKRLEMMLGVEDGVAKLLDTLEKRGILDNTYVFFTSDHGLFMGEHGFPAGKGEPYEELTRVVLYVRGPGVPVGTSDAFVASVDLAPTFAAIAGAKTPDDIDGRSFLPLLHGQPLAQPRKRFLLEWFDPYGKVLWQGLRTSDHRKYLRYADGTCKNFALDSDPYELASLACDDDFAKQSAAYIDRLAACVGAACAKVEDE